MLQVSPWISKKIKDLLGVEEPSLVDFVVDKLRERSPAAKVFEELHAIVDEEAGPFVLKLYRMVIYETEKYAAGLV